MRPGSSRSPSCASATGRTPTFARMYARRLGTSAERWSTTSTAAGRSAGSSATRRVSASTPPADVPMTMRRSAERSRFSLVPSAPGAIRLLLGGAESTYRRGDTSGHRRAPAAGPVDRQVAGAKRRRAQGFPKAPLSSGWWFGRLSLAYMARARPRYRHSLPCLPCEAPSRRQPPVQQGQPHGPTTAHSKQRGARSHQGATPCPGKAQGWLLPGMRPSSLGAPGLCPRLRPSRRHPEGSCRPEPRSRGTGSEPPGCRRSRVMVDVCVLVVLFAFVALGTWSARRSQHADSRKHSAPRPAPAQPVAHALAAPPRPP